MRTVSRPLALVAALALTAALPAVGWADQKVGTANYSGIVKHVSMDNIKVYNPKDRSALSFLIWPKFDQVFSSDGKATYQMKDVKAGMYVKVYYDQKALGMRHADRILILNQANQKLRRE